MASIGKIIDGECKEFASDNDILVLSKEIIETSPVTFQKATELANVQSEDSISIALGKLAKLYEVLENGIGTAHAGKAVVTDEAGNLTALENVSSGDISKVPTAVQDGARRIVPTGSDLDTFWNDLSKVGSWGVPSISGVSNTPSGASAGVLDVMGSLGVEGNETYQRQIYLPYDKNAIHMRFKHPDGQGVTSPWETFYPSGKCYAVENFSGNFSEDALKIMLHNRMKTLAEEITKSGKGGSVPWSCIWWSVTFVCGQLTAFFNEGETFYATTCCLESAIYFGFGKATENAIRYFARMDIPKYTSNAPYVKVWGLGEWTSSGGNIPSDVQYGSVMRVYGQDEPGVGSVTDTHFLLISYAGSNASRLYTAYQSIRGSTTIPWTRIGGG